MNPLSYSHGTGAAPLRGSTIGQVFRETVDRHPTADALISPSQDFRATYAELSNLTSRVSRGLIALGVEKGDRVGLWAPNRYEWVVVQLAAAQVGAILVTLNPAYRRAELRYALNQSAISVLVMSASFRQTDFVQILEDVRPECQDLRQVIVMENDWDALLDAASDRSEQDLAAREDLVQFDDAAHILYTSGTTGSPKGAVLSHQGQINCGISIGGGLKYSEVDRVCLPVPLFHAFGLMMGVLACVAHGAAIVLPGEAFDPALTLDTVQRERCTSLYGVPTMFIQELGLDGFGDYDLSSLRTGIMGGAPCPREVMAKVHELMNMRDVAVMYGMTETAITTRTEVGDGFEKQISTVGRAMPFVEIKLVDAEGRIVRRGETGELCSRGNSTMLGYWGDEAATRMAIDDARWMHTGDLAVMDDDGFLRIAGRIKDMVIRGGENIYPTEVEAFLHTHPDIEDVQVIGVPSSRYGEEVMAFVRLRGSVVLSDDELTDFCRGQIATFKIPRFWKLVRDFPMTASGKVQKYKLREQAVDVVGPEGTAGTATA